MAHCCCEWEDTYISEKILYPAHCDMCDCRRNEIKVHRTVSVPKYRVSCNTCRCHNQPLNTICCCSHYEQETNKDFCLCYECRKIRGRSEASIHKRRTHLDYSLLETWFNRFDVDGDGYLDLSELQSLLQYLGTKKHHSYCKTALRKCDRDTDGRLSFPEFVHFWHFAACHDEDFVKKLDCSELSHIVRKYNIFPHTTHCKCLDYHGQHTAVAKEALLMKPPLGLPSTDDYYVNSIASTKCLGTYVLKYCNDKHPAQHTQCKCGQRDKIIPFIKHDDSAHHSSRKKSKLQVNKDREDPDKLPTMSMNRDNIF